MALAAQRLARYTVAVLIQLVDLAHRQVMLGFGAIFHLFAETLVAASCLGFRA